MSNARSDRPRATGRALLVVAVLATLGAVVLGVTALRPTSSDEVVLEVTPVSAVTTPDTVPLLPTPSTTASNACKAPPTAVAAASNDPADMNVSRSICPRP